MKTFAGTGPQPDWSEIFRLRPDLNPPGHDEAASFVNEKKNAAEAEKIRAQMQAINKDRVSYRNRNRNKSRSRR